MTQINTVFDKTSYNIFFILYWQDDQTVLAEDLRLCKVRLAEEAVERRFIFEVVSPTK